MLMSGRRFGSPMVAVYTDPSTDRMKPRLLVDESPIIECVRIDEKIFANTKQPIGNRLPALSGNRN